MEQRFEDKTLREIIVVNKIDFLIYTKGEKNMKKVLLVLMTMVLLTACGGSKEEKNELYLFNWSDYIPDEVVKDFEAETGIKVITDYYSSNEEMYAKVKAGGAGYDIVVPSTDYAEIMMKQDMLEKLDKSKLPNMSQLNEELASKITFDKDHDYVVPYAVGATGIAVNTKYVKDYEKSFDIYNREDLKNKMTLLDDMREVFTSALIIAGHSPETTDPSELADAKNIILGWKKNILKFDTESFGKGFANEEYWVVHGYYENIVSHLTDEQAENVDFFLPSAGAQMYIDSMTILKGAKNADNAHTFINYIHRPEVYVQIIDWLETPSINTGAAAIRQTEPVYTVEELRNANLMTDLGEALAPQSEAWNEVLAQ